MANILEFVRGLLTSSDEQQRFAGNPHGYLTAHGFDDLSGEDVAEAIRAVARTLPDDVSDHLAPFHSADDSLPPVRPQIGESELDAAVRQLQFATSLTPASALATVEPVEAEPEPVVVENAERESRQRLEGVETVFRSMDERSVILDDPAE